MRRYDTNSYPSEMIPDCLKDHRLIVPKTARSCKGNGPPLCLKITNNQHIMIYAYTTDNFKKQSPSINTVQPPFGTTSRISDRPFPISNHWHKTPKTFSVKALLELEPLETTTSLLGDRDRFWGWPGCKSQSLTCLTHGLISMLAVAVYGVFPGLLSQRFVV